MCESAGFGVCGKWMLSPRKQQRFFRISFRIAELNRECHFGALTLAGVVKMVVILGHICHDAEAVGNSHGDHVTGIQQGRDPQLLLSHLKGLQYEQGKTIRILNANTDKQTNGST